MKKTKELLCLHCFQKISPYQVYFQCPNFCRFCRQKKISQEEHRRFFKLSFWSRWKCAISGKIPLLAQCPCKPSRTEETPAQYSIERYCPKCLVPFPREAGEKKISIIAMIGAQGSGKTEFLQSLEYTARQQFSFRKILFNKHIPNTRIDPTQPASPSPSGFLYPPKVFAFQLSEEQNMAYIGHKSAGETMLAVFDIAGNEYTNMDPKNIRFLPHCDGLLVLCDPLANGKVLSILRDNQPVDPKIQTLYGIYQKQSNPLKAILEDILTHLNSMQKYIPIAIVVSKSDLICHPKILPKTSILHQNNYNPYFLDDLAIANTIEYLEIYEPGIYGLLANWQTDKHLVNYFTTSALGQAYYGGAINYRHPIRVLDPLLWLTQRIS